MAEKPQGTSAADSLGGLQHNTSPHLVPLGKAQTAYNVRIVKRGQLEVRMGLYPVLFDTSYTPSSYDAISLYRYQRPEGDLLIMQDANGVIKADSLSIP